MSQDPASAGNSSPGSALVGKELEAAQYMYANPQVAGYSQLDGRVQQVASPYIPVTSPSAASDQPCYSPVTPVQSPSNGKSIRYFYMSWDLFCVLFKKAVQLK